MFAAVFYLMGFANLGLQIQEPNSSSPGCGLTGMDREESGGAGFQSYKNTRDGGLVQKRVVRW